MPWPAPRTSIRVIDLRTQHIGPEELLVAAKVEFTETLTSPQVAAAIDEAEASIREAIPIASRIYIEPAVWREGHVPVPKGSPGVGEEAHG